jgi:hypothetical protein
MTNGGKQGQCGDDRNDADRAKYDRPPRVFAEIRRFAVSLRQQGITEDK